MRSRTRLAAAGFIAVLALSACAPAIATTAPSPSAEATVATVDGLPITVGELQRELRRARGAGTSNEATRTALRRLTAIKVQQRLMLREHVIADASYDSYLRSLATENARREVAIRNGEAVYGPTRLEPDYYFGYRFDVEVLTLKERLASSDQEYRDLIQRHVRQAEVDIEQDVLDRIPPQ